MEEILSLYNAREGTSQRTRLDENLLPENFQIDGRTTADLVKFATEFAESLNYYNTDGTVTKSWKDFFIKERYIYLYLIANTKLKDNQKSFYISYQLISILTDETDIKSQLQQLINPVYELLVLLTSWNTNLSWKLNTKDELMNLTDLTANDDFIKRLLLIFQIYKCEKPAGDWDSILSAFSLNEKFGSGYSDYIFRNDDTDQIKNIFEELYIFSENTIDIAKVTISKKEVSNQDVRPHVALFLGFLKIYEKLQGKINGITKRHLDYYFDEVLQLQKHKLKPDKAFVRFILNKDYESCLLEKGTAVVAGKDSSGVPVVYQTMFDTQLTKAKIIAIHTYFVSRNKLNYTGLPDQNEITDIFFKKHNPENLGVIKIFGEDQFLKSASERTMDNAPIGFIIASDCLKLSEGSRKICVDFIASNSSYKSFIDLIRSIDQFEGAGISNFEFTFYRIFSTAFDVFVVLDGIETKYNQFKIVNKPDNSGISLELMFSSDDPELTELKTPEIEKQQAYKKPYIKVLLRDESHIYSYPLIQRLDLINISMKIDVEGVKDILLFNNYGQIDHSVPFQFFGAIPKVNSYFLLGSPELYKKPIKSIDINLDWFQLPSDPDGWSGYFADYDTNILNSDFKVEIEYLQSGSWNKLKSNSVYPLFEEEKINEITSKKLSAQTHFENLELPVDQSESKVSDNFSPFTLKTRNGYIKIELISPEFSFGFEAYRKNLYKSIRENAQKEEGSKPKVPNPPFSPMVKSITLNYTIEIEAISEKGPSDIIELYSIGPVGYKRLELKSLEKPVKILFKFQPEGHLLIGLDSYPTDGIINFFFKTKSGNEESYIREVPVPKWQYLENDFWVDMPENAIILDNTKGFVQSGIISMKIPDSIANDNTIIDDKLYWIKASVTNDSQIAPDVLGIYTNVAEVIWDKASDSSHLTNPLPFGSISKLQKFDPRIASVDQVSEAFHGKEEENETNFYVRVSERLRHKNRAYTNWDYERLLLEEFPFVYKVKCFNAVKYAENPKEEKKYVEPGNVLIVVTPDTNNPNITNLFKPRFGISLLIRMKDYLQKLSSPFVKVEVRNPFYESIRVICQVKFHQKHNTGFYISKLNDDLIAYINPWLSKENIDEQFGNCLYRSKIMSFVNKRDYVEFVTSFSIVKINSKQEYYNLFDTALEKGNDEIIYPEFPWSILTSDLKHDITAIDDLKYREPIPRGISNMKLGVDFVIKK